LKKYYKLHKEKKMGIKKGIIIILQALFMLFGIMLISNCTGGFTVTFGNVVRSPSQEPVIEKPPERVEKEKPPERVRTERPPAPPEQPEAAEEPAEETRSPEEKHIKAPVTEEKVEEIKTEQEAPAQTAEQPAITEEKIVTEEKAEEKAPVEEKVKEKAPVEEKAEEKAEKKEKSEKEIGEEQKPKEKEKEQQIVKEQKPAEKKENTAAVKGIVSLEKNIFYITDVESKKRYKLVGLKKEEKYMLKKLIGSEVSLELKIVSTESKKAYIAQLLRMIEEEVQPKEKADVTTPDTTKPKKK